VVGVQCDVCPLNKGLAFCDIAVTRRVVFLLPSKPKTTFTKRVFSNELVIPLESLAFLVFGSIVGCQYVTLNAPIIFAATVNAALINEVHRTFINAIIALNLGKRNFVFVKTVMAYHHALEGGSIPHLGSSTGHWPFRGRLAGMRGGNTKVSRRKCDQAMRRNVLCGC
jgi:hypothetical protein